MTVASRVSPPSAAALLTAPLVSGGLSRIARVIGDEGLITLTPLLRGVRLC